MFIEWPTGESTERLAATTALDHPATGSGRSRSAPGRHGHQAKARFRRSPGWPHRHLAVGVLQDHGRLGRADLSTEKAVFSAAIALVIRPIGKLARRRIVTDFNGAFANDHAENDLLGSARAALFLGSFGARAFFARIRPRTLYDLGTFGHPRNME